MMISRRAWPLMGAAVAAAVILVVPTPAMAATHAAKPAGGGHGGGGGGGGGASTTGYDISWPQCGSTYPSGQAFGIVGLNGGLANDFNACFDSEVAWAQLSPGLSGQAPASIYLNTADPGSSVSDWPTGSGQETDPYGSCSGGDTNACAWQYGYNLATNDVARAKAVTGATSVPWWLDVETGNSWLTGSPGVAMNVADLQGMEQGLKDAGITAGAGIYSTSYQWGVITGSDTTDFAGVPDWIPGARTERGAKSNCGLTPFTGSASKVTLTQWTGTFDNDYYCG